MTPTYTPTKRVFDLLATRHEQVRRANERIWNEQESVHLSNSEWYVLAQIYGAQPTIADVTRGVHISRQATHKLIHNLNAKGLVTIFPHPTRRKDKCVALTTFGMNCYERNEALKAQLEENIEATIGKEAMVALRDLLQRDWNLT